MGEVVKLKRPRKGTIRGAAREMLTDAMASVGGKPVAIVMVVLAADGRFALRRANYDEPFKDFDILSRAGHAISRSRDDLLEVD